MLDQDENQISHYRKSSEPKDQLRQLTGESLDDHARCIGWGEIHPLMESLSIGSTKTLGRMGSTRGLRSTWC